MSRQTRRENLHVDTRNKIDSSSYTPNPTGSVKNACLKMHRKPPVPAGAFLIFSVPVILRETVERDARVYIKFIPEQNKEIS